MKGAGDGELSALVGRQTAACLEVYETDLKRVEEDCNLEAATAEGGYGRRQLFELVQNGADQLLESPGRVSVDLTADCLYVANEGAPVSREGLLALMGARHGVKRGEEIGRFGLGFKSVVAITDEPQVYSSSVSFGFDRSWAADRIREVVPGRQHYPMLRVARPLDPYLAREGDRVLDELLTWAQTVVRLPLKDPKTHSALMRADMASFPAQFLLFTPHVRQLTLNDRVSGATKDIRLALSEDDVLTLDESGSQSEWIVRKKKHRPSAEAAADAGQLTNREIVELNWAVPMRNRSALGEFWAFFPTGEKTTLSGIVNAPWKLSDDRRSLLEGAFNEELLAEVLPKLVADDFASLAAKGDPASALDVLPARGRESRNWADEVINQPIFDALQQRSSLPDGLGQFQLPKRLRIHPRGLRMKWLSEWFASAPDLQMWVHPAVEAPPERRLKADRLLENQRRGTDLKEWVEWICRNPTAESSARALSILATICREDPELEREARTCRVLLLEDGLMAEPRTGNVFIRSGPEEEGFNFIDSELASLPGVAEDLKALDIRILDRSGELLHALSRGQQTDWERVWSLARRIPTGQAEEVFHKVLGDELTGHVLVRTAAQRWTKLSNAFLGGQVVPLDGSRDRDFLIDPRFHGPDEELLRRLGAVEKPALRSFAVDEPWLRAYRESLIDTFVARTRGSRPSREKIVVEGPNPPWPLESLNRLTDQSRLEMTEIVLTLDSRTDWTVRHTTNLAYGSFRSLSPALWWLKRHGRLRTPFGPWPVDQSLSPTLVISEELPEKVRRATERVLPIADVSTDSAERLGLVEDLPSLPQAAWDLMLERARSWADTERQALLYSWAVHHMEEPPRTLAVQIGGRSRDCLLGEIAVVREADECRALIEQGIPTILVGDDADKRALMERWGLSDGDRMLEQELVAEPNGEPVVVVDRFPGLGEYIDPGLLNLELVTCSSLDIVTRTPRGLVSSPVPGMVRDGQILVRAGSDFQLIGQISHALELDLSDAEISALLNRQEKQRARDMKARIRRASSDAQRLAVAIGGGDLRRAIPKSALDAVERERSNELTDVELAQMAIAVHGPDVLKQYRVELAERGLEPPQQWAGRSAARRFVMDLGFAKEYAGFPEARRPATLDVDGPAALADLHDFQILAAERIKSLIRGEGPPRGMLALPTGAGKTRVVVQALTEEVRDGTLEGPLLWIAQSDELCEQAVQTWAYVWRAIGPPGRLVVSRFWGSNDVVEEVDAVQLVVATPEKLTTAVGKPKNEWMTRMSLVVVDEAHASVAPSYTAVLEWLGRGRSRKAGHRLIGLTATPFRNVNRVETDRLAARYDRNRLDEDAFTGDPYVELQSKKVLAQVRHELLRGVDVALTASDRQEIDKLRRLPSAVEGRLGANIDRNVRIVDSVATLPDDWTVLLFATTVENARALAAQLTFRGIPSVAVSAQTEPAARRRYIEQFQNGEIRVITNYNVLAQGFDAPAVRAVYVTRPTFSTNLYQQMIGRGLRGPLNGGSDEVLIVNVADNFEAFGENLAFNHFEYLWDGSAGAE